MRFFWEWMLAMRKAAIRRDNRPERAAERRTIAALSESGEPGGEEPPTPEEPLTPEEALATAEESSALMAELPDAGEEPQLPGSPVGRGVARNTAIFSILTGVSRIVGLLREIVAASFFGTKGPASAFTLAFQVPNLFANLFANAALSAAFVPVFTELLQKGRKKEAFRLASTLFWILLIGLGALYGIQHLLGFRASWNDLRSDRLRLTRLTGG